MARLEVIIIGLQTFASIIVIVMAANQIASWWRSRKQRNNALDSGR
jgi:hypothetical protein